MKNKGKLSKTLMKTHFSLIVKGQQLSTNATRTNQKLHDLRFIQQLADYSAALFVFVCLEQVPTGHGSDTFKTRPTVLQCQATLSTRLYVLGIGILFLFLLGHKSY